MTEVVQEQPVLGLCFPAELFDEEALANTPGRILRMMEEFREWREWKDLETGRGIFPTESDDLVIVRDINFTSFCAHHILPFSGTASVAYLPTTHIVGLSKIPRTVRKFASRPQLQEYLTSQIADYLTSVGARGALSPMLLGTTISLLDFIGRKAADIYFGKK
jgi:GTP cyclohydrolase I